MRVLVACEYSGTVREAFRAAGHDAWSCDLEADDNDSPYHLQGDALYLAEAMEWDLMIAHPPCTYLSVSGARWFYHPDDGHLPTEQRRPHPNYPNRRSQQDEAVAFFIALAELPIPKIAIENPVCVMSTRYRKPDQVIQPYEHGEPFKKSTCLWLKGLPLLEPTDIVEPRIKQYADGSRFSADYAFTTGKSRSKSYQGIANAMAAQWGG